MSLIEPLGNKILLVEDDVKLQNALRWILEDDDLEILGAASAGEALAIVESDPPDLVLCDVNLSGSSGIDVCRKMKNDPTKVHIPILLLSAIVTEGDLPSDVIYDGFVKKPFDVPQLYKLVRFFLR